jgi:hypothetical protein
VIISHREIVIADSQSCTCNQDEGGRLIMLTWELDNSATRESLQEAVECALPCYHPDCRVLQQRRLPCWAINKIKYL